MVNVNVGYFQKNIADMLEQVIRFNKPISIRSKHGNAVLMKAEEYNDIMATIGIYSYEQHQKLIEGLNTNIDECISEEDVVW